MDTPATPPSAPEPDGRTALVRAWLSTTALFLSGIYFPVAGTLLMVFTPQPGLSLERRSGKHALVPLVVLTAATAALAAGARVAILYLAGFAMLTWVLAGLLRRGSSIEATVALTTAFGTGAVLAGAVLFSPSIDGVFAALRVVLEDSWQALVDLYRRAGMPPDAVDRLTEGGDRLVDVVVRISPALVVILFGTVVLANLGLVRWRERRAGASPPFGDLSSWSAPPAAIWVLVFAGYASFLPWPFLRGIAWNVVAIVLAVYFCQGLAILQFTFRAWRVPAWGRGFAYAFVAFEWLAAAVVLLLGIFDLWGDFRQLRPRPVEDD